MNILALPFDRLSRRIVYCWLAFALLVASLLLPSFEYVFFGVTSFVPGWGAAWFALSGSIEGIFSPKGSIDGYWGFFAAGAAAITNLVFLAAPFILRKRPLARRRRTALAIVVGSGLALGIVSRLYFADQLTRFLIGYQLWLCAYVALAVAILSAWIEDRTAKPDQ